MVEWPFRPQWGTKTVDVKEERTTKTQLHQLIEHTTPREAPPAHSTWRRNWLIRAPWLGGMKVALRSKTFDWMDDWRMGENCELQTTWVYNFPRIKILAITFSSTIDRAVHKCWAQMTGRVKAQAKQAYGRDLCLAQRVPYVEVSLLATMWYTAKIFPDPTMCTLHLTTTIAWYIWHGATFRTPLTLQKTKQQGVGQY